MKILEMEKINEKDIPELHFAVPNWNKIKGERKRLYFSEICAFDIETTTIKEIRQSIMYVWQFSINNECVIIGRTWEEFKRLVTIINKKCNGIKLICFVHNLSYEFTWLSGIFHFENEDVFCTDSRKVLRADLGDIEFRCSYLLSNMSLDEMTEQYEVEHKKKSGEEFNYKKLRYPWTELNEYEQEYIINDVVGLIEAVRVLMDIHEDTVYTLPLTSTGFVRRVVREKMKPFRNDVIEMFPDWELYKLLKANFRGGNTHANRYFTDELIDDRIIHSVDISSSYPSSQCNRLYPMSKFVKCKNVRNGQDKIENLISRNYAVIFDCTFYGIELKDEFISVPYIPYTKAKKVVNFRNDNGRVLDADIIEHLVLTDIDYSIIENQYKWDRMVVHSAYYAFYDKLPSGIIDCNIEFFKLKTELKNVDGLMYGKNKALLNAIYGLTCQSPTKLDIMLNDFDAFGMTPENVAFNLKGLYNTIGWNLNKEDRKKVEEAKERELLQKARLKSFLVYQWSCWTTAHSRKALQVGIDLCGDGLIYCDTDSCKYIGDADFSAYNEEQKQLSIESGIYATDKKGITHYAGMYEKESDMKAFITQGAKKYAYVDMKNRLHITVSGVGKDAGAKYLNSVGGIEAFRKGLVFRNCGKTTSYYNDLPYGTYNIDGHDIYISRNVVIEDTTYTLTRTDDYDKIISEAKSHDIQRMREHLKNVNF